MNKVSFLQEKSAFHMKYPDQSDLSFYRWFTEQYPDEAIGWYHLGRERESRGEMLLALSAQRRALHAKPGPYSEEAREAYQALLRSQKQQERKKNARLLLASFLYLYFQFAFSPGPLTEPASSWQALVSDNSTPAQIPARPHVEVIAVPPALTAAQLQIQVRRYVEARRPSLVQPYTVIVVPEVKGSPLFTPLLFYRPNEIRGMLRFDPINRTVISQKWFDQPGLSEKYPALHDAKAALAEEQLTLQQVITLRNALYRTYQQKGRLPGRLADLAGPLPGNALAQIPLPPKGLGLREYTYRPEAFRPQAAWESMRDVLPLPGYPEPLAALEPLQIHLNEATHALELRSGSHRVRSYPAGMGKNGSTPEGYYTILQKINRPHGHENIYGTRGMVFQSDGYAIHGTNHPMSIGQSVSLGCVRLLNTAVDELYSFVSLGTEVIITNVPAPDHPWSNPDPFLLAAGPEEETPHIIYQWLH